MIPADPTLVSFKGHLRVKSIPTDTVLLISEREVAALSGYSINTLAPLLDGTRTVAQVKQEVSPLLSATDVEELLGRLSESGLITYQAASTPREDGAHAYWSLAGIDTGAAISALESSSVDIVATRRVPPRLARIAADACRASGLIVASPGTHPTAALSIVLCEDYLEPELGRLNAERLSSGRPWLLAKPSGAVLWVGPIFRPAEGPCWECLAKRLGGNRIDSFLARRAEEDASDVPQLASSPSTGTGLRLTALEAMKWLAGIRNEPQASVYTLDTIDMRGSLHRVSHRPQCLACGDSRLMSDQGRRPVKLVPRRIGTSTGNGQRVLSARTVLEKYGHLVDPVTGIVGELRRHPGCPEFLHSYQSGRNRAITGTSILDVRVGLRAQSGGKGASETEAKAGALCEAIERYCATLDGDEVRVTDSYRGLGGQAIHPNSCQLFDQRQFADRARWNADCAPFHRVPEPFDEQDVTDWTPMWSLLDEKHRLLPTGMLYFHSEPRHGPVSVLADSNGNATGGTIEDAILQGFLELVERDAVALWWYNRTRQAPVDLESFDDRWLADLIEQYARRLNRDVWVLDVTSDLGIPVMAAVSRRTDKREEDIMLGFGAHFDPGIALRRAVTELGQMIPAVAGAQANGSGYDCSDPHLRRWWRTATIENQPYVLPDQESVPRTAASYEYTPSGELDLSLMEAAARDAGLKILVLDQTRPDVQMPAVKVVVPGLRHFWPRFAPGRLFDVPVDLGRIPERTPYEDINPIPLFLLPNPDDQNTASGANAGIHLMSKERDDGPLHGATELWSLREDVHVRIESAQSPVLLISEWGNVTIHRPSPEVREALRRMQLGPVSLENVLRSVETPGDGAWDPSHGIPSLTRLHDALDRLQPLIIRSLGFEHGQPLISVVPMTPQARFRPVRLPANSRVRLSVFARLQTDGHEYHVESPLSVHRALLHRPEAIALLGSLGRPVSVAASASSWPGTESLAADLLAYLAAAEIVVDASRGEPGNASVLGWSPEDLAFHTRSSRGRHDRPVGRTYPMGREGSPEPVTKPRAAGPSIALHRPTWESLIEKDPSLAVAMEARRSIRAYGTEAVPAEEVGDLLYRAARVRAVVVPPPADGESADHGARDAKLSNRPYPGGGACYELEIYVTLGNCDGISPGTYHYDPLGHLLEPVNSDRNTTNALLGAAGHCAGLDVPPPILITLTARVQRLSWKYEGIVYATVMKDAGILLQNLYLAATAMRLAPCAIGSVNIDGTARAFGVDWRTEPSVAQFILGRAPKTPPRREWEWTPVNDAQWADRAENSLDYRAG